MTTSIRIVTLNLWGDNGPHERRLELIAGELVSLKPDVVALQEVREVPGRLANQAQILSHRLGYEHAFAPSTEWGGGRGGQAVVSRFPIAENVTSALPHSPPAEGRIIQSVCVTGPRGPFWVHNTHLSYRQHEGRQREDQVLLLDEVASARAVGNEQPRFLVGDFNTGPDNDEIRWLCGRTTLGDRRVFYQDAWETVHPDQPGVTWARENPFRARMGWLRADRRIDYVFVSAERRDGRGRVLEARRVFDRADSDGIFPSDHYGVMADVQIAADEDDAATRTAG